MFPVFFRLCVAELVGLSLTYGLALNSCLSAVVFLACQVENLMVSAERIGQYSDIPSEAPLVVEGSRTPADWPTTGSVEFRNLEVSLSSEKILFCMGNVMFYEQQLIMGKIVVFFFLFAVSVSTKYSISAERYHIFYSGRRKGGSGGKDWQWQVNTDPGSFQAG